jgi:hypothetical protein
MLANLKALGIDTLTLTRHTTLGAAKANAASFTTVRLVVQGCDDRFWVVSARNAAKDGLIRQR